MKTVSRVWVRWVLVHVGFAMKNGNNEAEARVRSFALQKYV